MTTTMTIAANKIDQDQDQTDKTVIIMQLNDTNTTTKSVQFRSAHIKEIPKLYENSKEKSDLWYGQNEIDRMRKESSSQIQEGAGIIRRRLSSITMTPSIIKHIIQKKKVQLHQKKILKLHNKSQYDDVYDY